MNFYSVTLIGSSSEWRGAYSLGTSSYNMNEVLFHKYDGKYEKPAWPWAVVLSILGAGIGIFCAPVIFKKNFPSFWYFALLVIGAIAGFIASLFLLENRAKRKQAVAERQQKGFTGRFVIIEQNKWKDFDKSLRPQTEMEKFKQKMKR